MLTSVRLRNFKSFREAEIRLGPVNFLVGPNMSGKSNFIQALQLLRRICFPAEPGQRGLANAFPGGPLEHTWKGWDSRVMGFALHGEYRWQGDSLPAQWEYELELIVDQWGAVRIQKESLWILDRQGQHELIHAANDHRRLVNRDGQSVVHQMERERAAIELDIPHWDGAFVRQVIGSWYFYQLTPHAMRNINPAAAAMSLAPHGENLSSWLLHLQTRYGEAFGKISQLCKDVLPGFARLFTWPTPQGTVSLGSNEEHLKRPLSLWEMSDGELVFIALVSLLLSPPELAGGLYCLEEPENHLHPRLMEELVELMRLTAGGSQSPVRSQVIATTHSLHLIDCLRLEEILVFQKSEGATLVSSPKDKAHLRQLLADRELGLGDLYYSGALAGG